jgi:Rhodopirellula transposase DDE domain
VGVIDIEPIRERFSAVAPFLDERGRHLVAAAEALAAGYGGIAAVAIATGVAPSTIGRRLKELAQDEPPAFAGAGSPSGFGDRERDAREQSPRACPREGGDPTLLPDLEALVEPTTRGDPESPLRWTCKSLRRLAQALQAQGHAVSRTLVPVISVDPKKKELVGDFRNNGREYRPHGNPEEVRVHDFPIKELGRAVPYGVYDLAANSGWVSVGVDHDTATFAVNSIRQWWHSVGRARYPKASRRLITATPARAKAGDGGSNGSPVRLWKRELQKLANEFGIDIVVSHLPPGTSKWNKIEHRLFSFISQNWRAKPLVSYRVIPGSSPRTELISATNTKTGLTMRCELGTGQYPSGIVVSDAEMAALNIKRAGFRGEWNYTISPGLHRPNRAFIS